MDMQLEFDRETDGRWIAEVVNISGAMAYGETKQEAEQKARAIAMSVVSEHS